jgi:hypothetical protein
VEQKLEEEKKNEENNKNNNKLSNDVHMLFLDLRAGEY